jgi:carboxypeptidase C (cathepsin A)
MSPILFALLTAAAAQEPSPGPSPSAGARAEKPAETKAEKPAEPPVVTHHQIQVGGRALAYTVTTGMMPLKNDQGETEANIFFMAYTADRAAGGARPLMFSFNGGPGSSSVWLHMGALGPKRVRMLDDGALPPPPYQLGDNEHTWLEFTDLVFIDPVGTGFSRATKPELGKKFWSVEGDIQSVGEFIRLYLTRYERWNSPLFLIGESYGTTRAAGLAGHLVDRGIALNGVVLISTILNFQTARFSKGNDLPYVLFLPTYSAIAWYHKKLPAEMQQRALPDFLAEVEGWAVTDYLETLGKGDRLSAAERQAAVDRLNRYTGLEKRFIDNSDLRIEIQRFTKELLRDQKRTVGRLDGRFKGMDVLAASERPDFDPSMAAIRPPYTALFNHYVRTALGYKNDSVYHILGGGIGPWDFNVPGGGFADTSEALRSAFAKNPYMKLFVAEGYYDLATPYFATEYTLSHMGLDPAVRGNVSSARYEAGHMMYIDTRELAKLRRDGEAFVKTALAHKQ